MTDFSEAAVEIARLTAENKVLAKQLAKAQADNHAITLALINREDLR